MPNAFGGFLHISPLSNLSSSTSLPPSPSSALASNCIRDYFGPMVQTVADCLVSRGSSTLSELVAYIKAACVRDWNQERGRLVDALNSKMGNAHEERGMYYNGKKVHMNKARGSEMAGFITDPTHIRAALLVLLQHSLIAVSGGKPKDSAGSHEAAVEVKADPTSSHTHYTYTFLADRARLLPRYPRYVERARQTVDENGAMIVETLLIHGRMRAEDVLACVWDVIKRGMDAEGEDAASNSGNTDDAAKDWDEDEPSMEEIEAFFSSDKVTSSNSGGEKASRKQQALRDIVASFKKLTEAGYIEGVKPIITAQEMIHLQDKEKEAADGIRGGEFEFNVDADGTIVASDKKKRPRSASVEDSKTSKKMKQSSQLTGDENDVNDYGGTQSQPDNPEIVAHLEPLRKLIPPGSVYRVNTGMCHASLRAMIIGRMVQEFYGPQANMKSNAKDDNNLLHAGGIVTAALTFGARQEHAPIEQILGLEESEEDKHRRMAEWGAFTPSDIVPYLPADALKAMQSLVGGTLQNLSATLIRMSQLKYPPIVVQVEDASGHPSGGKFEICTRQLLQRLRDRILHRIITQRHGLVAARIVSLLHVKGHMESDAIAEDAMVPAKEAREILHRLHRDKYVNLFDMHMTKTHNSATAIYLWHVIQDRLLEAVLNDVYLAIFHLRLRRQHEVEVGKDWMDRAKEAGATEENAHEEDKRRYHKFCKGLERLDCACLQLDETLMVLKDL
eukprot:CCRYP_008085-RA/>CCRYP_008085-RA protein AED:0.00 eAED:0.00 QI:255/-1/1/1/-1/1/1/17/730